MLCCVLVVYGVNLHLSRETGGVFFLLTESLLKVIDTMRFERQLLSTCLHLILYSTE